jgi:predicted nuclease of restriction endonuclease-like RecB superfamily
MLTSDLVRVKRRGDTLSVSPLGPRNRPLALEAASQYLALTERHVGRTRAEWEEACDGVVMPARAKKLNDGLRKLIDDRCTFAMEEGPDPVVLRDEVFALARARRSELGPGDRLDRGAVIADVAASQGLTVEQLDERLYGDLKSAWRLLSWEPIDAEGLVAHYEMSQGQAVLLRAARLTVVVHRAAPKALRALFHRLKFLRLVYVIEAMPHGEHRIELDGPLSLFGPSTKYGLQLAMLLPALDRTGPWSLDARVLWGPEREPVRFHLEGGPAAGGDGAAGDDVTENDEITTLLDRLKKAGGDWIPRRNTKVLDLPGVGLCVPDLVLSRGGERVYVEVMGYWSRDAVWRRVELVEGGLKERILFCVSSRLRVSEEALGKDLPGSLYVYKGVMSSKQILEKVEALAAR